MDPDFLSMAAESLLLKLLLKLPPGWPPHALTVRAEHNGTVALLQMGPPTEVGKPAPATPQPSENLYDLTPCERATLRVTLAASRGKKGRLTFPEIKEIMRGKGLGYGDSTMHRALALLVECGYLANDHDGRGYGPPDEF